MAHKRITISLALKMPVLPDVQAKIDKLVAEIMEVQKSAVTVNEGKDNAEPSIASTHICHHDEGLPCEPPVLIKAKAEAQEL